MILRSEHSVRSRPSSPWSLLKLRKLSEARERSALRLPRDGEGAPTRAEEVFHAKHGVERVLWTPPIPPPVVY